MLRTMKLTPELDSRWKVVIALLAVIAAGLSLWLTIEKLNGTITTLAGCGGGSDCANVMGSKWSMVLGVIPVSVFSLLLYLGILVSLWMKGNAVGWSRQLAAWIIIGSAGWFTVLQLEVLGSFCKYCMTMHGVGFLLASAIIIAEFRKTDRLIRQTAATLPCAVILVVSLAMLQKFGPQPPTHRLDDLTVKASSGDVSSGDIHSQGEGRVVKFFGGRKAYRVDELPHIGKADAEHVLVKYFDYTCAACREMHDDLDLLLEKYPKQLCIVVLPVPLNKRCNPNLPIGVHDHAKACEFARLGLQVWRADPQKFAEFHDWLFGNNAVPVEAAEAMAASLVGDENLPAENDSWVDAVQKQNVADYKIFAQDTPVMPKLAIKDAMMMQGVTRNVEELEDLLKKRLNLR